jgi:hypothetical protein
MLTSRSFAVATVLTALVALSVSAQTYVPATTTDVFTREFWAEASSFATWHDLEVGKWALDVGGAHAWGQPGVGGVAFVLSGEARTAATDRVEASDVIRAGAALKYEITDSASAWISADAVALPHSRGERTTSELAAGLNLTMPVWLPERHPRMIVEARHDFGRYDVNYLRGALRLDYEFPLWGKRTGLMAEIGHVWSGYPPGGRAGRADFGSQATDMTLVLLSQSDAAVTFSRQTRSFEPFVSLIRSRRNSRSMTVNAGFRVVLVK